jgi:hypothetical protein
MNRDTALSDILSAPYQLDITPADGGNGFVVGYPELNLFALTYGSFETALDLADQMLRTFAVTMLDAGNTAPIPAAVADWRDIERETWAVEAREVAA